MHGAEIVAPLMNFNWTLAMQVVTIIVLFLVLKKFFFEKIYNFVQEREKEVQSSYEKADETNRTAEIKLKEYDEKIAKIEAEAREMVKESKIRADSQARTIVDNANEKATQILVKSQKEVEKQQSQAIEEMKSEIVKISISAAEKIIEEKIKEDNSYNQIVEKAIKDVGGTKWQN
ncbi:MAG: F0F1 ATP synthase subunit B [Anaerovoracaceae bacterium]